MPLALADIMSMMFALVRMWAADQEKVKIPKRSESLASWCLPMMAQSVKAGEDEQDALALFESVKRLADKQKAKDNK